MTTPDGALLRGSALARLTRQERGRKRRDSLSWFVGTLVVCGAVALATTSAPALAIPALLGIGALYVSFRWPFAIAFTTLVVLAMTSMLDIALGQFGSMLDDVLVLLCAFSFTVRRIWLERAVVIPPALLWFGGFLLVGVMSSLAQDVPTSIWVQQAFLSLKGFVLAVGFAQLPWNRRRLKGLIVAGAIATVIFLICGTLNLLITEEWVRFTKIRTPITVFGIPALNGPYAQPAAFGRITAIIGVAAFCYILTTRRVFAPLLAFITTTTLAVLTVTVKTLTSMTVVYGLLLLRVRAATPYLVLIGAVPIFAIIALPVLVDLFQTDLTAYFFNDEVESARSLLTGGAFEIAAQNFPLGAGFGRYGTYLAASEYSPEYIARDWTWRYGLGEAPEWGRYLTDTQWPAFLGETGWLGTFFFAAGLIAMLLSMTKPIGPIEPPLYTWIRWSGIGWLILITVESIAAPVYTSPPAFAFAFIGSAIVAALRHDYRTHGETFALQEYHEAPDDIRREALRRANRSASRGRRHAAS